MPASTSTPAELCATATSGSCAARRSVVDPRLRLFVLLLCVSQCAALAALPAARVTHAPARNTRSALHLAVTPALAVAEPLLSPHLGEALGEALRQAAESGRGQVAREALSSWHMMSGMTEQTAGWICRALFPVYHNAVCSWHSDRAEWAAAELRAAQEQVAAALGVDVAYRIEGRVKSALSLFEKSVLRRKSVSDLIGLRIVVPDELGEAECYRVCGVLSRLWPEGSVQFKDYIAHPKENGYQSLHLLLTTPGAKIEVQIRTERMQHTAEHGSAAHSEYKALSGSDTQLVFVPAAAAAAAAA